MELVLFEENKTEKLERLCESLQKELSNLRRGLFARHAVLAKKYQETALELEILKESIAKQEKHIWTSRSSNFTQLKKQNTPSLGLYTYI